MFHQLPRKGVALSNTPIIFLWLNLSAANYSIVLELTFQVDGN